MLQDSAGKTLAWLASGLLLGCQWQPAIRNDTPPPASHAVSQSFAHPLNVSAASVNFVDSTVHSKKKKQPAAPILSDTYTLCDSAKYASILMDFDTGEPIYGDNIHERRSAASLTKLMTSYLAFEALENGGIRLDDVLKYTLTAADKAYYIKFGLRQFYLQESDHFTVRQALTSIGPGSAADVTDMLGSHVAASWKTTSVSDMLAGEAVDDRKKFIARMNECANTLGMHDTHFTNTSGGPDDPDQSTDRSSTTAYDMAIMLRAMKMRFPEQSKFYETRAFPWKKYVYDKKTKKLKWKKCVYSNLSLKVSGAIIGKTGVIDASGYNQMVLIKNGGHNYIVGTFGARTKEKRLCHTTEFAATGLKLVAARSHAADSLAHARNQITNPINTPPKFDGWLSLTAK